MILTVKHPAARYVEDVLLDSVSVMHRGVIAVNTELGVVEVNRNEEGKIEKQVDRINTFLLRGTAIEIRMKPGHERMLDEL